MAVMRKLSLWVTNPRASETPAHMGDAGPQDDREWACCRYVGGRPRSAAGCVQGAGSIRPRR